MASNSDKQPNDERDLHVFDETSDPTEILDDINPERIFECNDCGNTWSDIAADVCTDCGSTNKELLGKQTTVRAKWTLDGAEDVDAAIDKFEFRKKQLQALKDAGWEIRDPVTDDYAHLFLPVEDID